MHRAGSIRDIGVGRSVFALAAVLFLLAPAISTLVPTATAVLVPPTSAKATLYSDPAWDCFGLCPSIWAIDINEPNCRVGGVRELNGIYDDSLSWVDFGVAGAGCSIIFFDGHAGAGASVVCNIRNEVTCLQGFDNVASSYLAVPGPSAIFRDDDGTMEANLDFDYSDDVAYKDFVINTTDVVGGTSAMLWIYAKGQNCGTPPEYGEQYLTLNGDVITWYDPCQDWSDASFGWTALEVPLQKLIPGSNRFRLHDSGLSWTDWGLFLGIDAGHDNGNSVASSNGGPDAPGELMWYLEIVKL
jgi:hypothetical protein